MMEPMTFPLAIRTMILTQSREEAAGVSVMGEDEFRSFYERTARPLWSYLSRLTGDRQKADDLLQETYYRFYRAGTKHESESHRRNSLFNIATNLVRDAARRGRRYEEVALQVEPETPSAEKQVAIRTDVARALQRLEPMQREILWLAYAQGASHEEIAEIVGVRAISVRTLLFRARKKMAALLKGKTR
jgi:RNA polymerase sigma-70 factor (ECF subfamily)